MKCICGHDFDGNFALIAVDPQAICRIKQIIYPILI